MYLDVILGPWELAGAVIVLLPGFPRVKEWAYAGFFFSYSGAVASHLLVGDGPTRWMPPPLVLAIFTVGSWVLRPADRRAAAGPPPAQASRLAYPISARLLVVMLIASFVALPKGSPTGY